MNLSQPKISLITPSYSQGNFLEQTILSIIEQKYSSLEYIVIDGGSIDNSVEILTKYSDKINFWCSESDGGQADALNKGFERSTGEICGYINSDDLLLPGALELVANLFRDEKVKWVSGPILVGTNLQESSLWNPRYECLAEFTTTTPLPQQGIFWRKDVLPRPYFDENFHFVLDHAFFVKIAELYGAPLFTDTPLAFFRQHPAAKTSRMHDILLVEADVQIQQALDRAGPSAKMEIGKYVQKRKFRNDLFEYSQEWNKGITSKFEIFLRIISLISGSPKMLGERNTLRILKSMFKNAS